MKTKKPTAAEKKAAAVKEMINQIYHELKERMIHPTGKFDSGGRWFAENSELINVRSPSRAYPWSEMTACRSKKYVKACFEKFKCKKVEDLRAAV